MFEFPGAITSELNIELLYSVYWWLCLEIMDEQQYDHGNDNWPYLGQRDGVLTLSR